MSPKLQESWSFIEGTHGMRSELLATLSDSDLTFNPGGQNMSLGALCREMGDIEYSYIQSLKTFTQDWSYSNTDAALETSLTAIKAWYQSLDDEMKNVVSTLSDEDVTKTIDRGGFSVPANLQLDIYLQALLIFFGKATIYLKAMNKPLPDSIRDWIG